MLQALRYNSWCEWKEATWWEQLLCYASVKYSLQHVCNGHMVTLFPQIVWSPHFFMLTIWQSHVFLLAAKCKIITSVAIFFNLTIFFQKTQYRNQASSILARSLVVLQWPWGDKQFLPCLGCLENRMVVVRRLHSCRTIFSKSYGHLTLIGSIHKWLHDVLNTVRPPCSHLRPSNP